MYHEFVICQEMGAVTVFENKVVSFFFYIQCVFQVLYQSLA